jgi:hypothetical protein
MTFALGFIAGWITTSIVTLFAIAGMLAGKRADAVRRVERSRRRNLFTMLGLTETGNVNHERRDASRIQTGH